MDAAIRNARRSLPHLTQQVHASSRTYPVMAIPAWIAITIAFRRRNSKEAPVNTATANSTAAVVPNNPRRPRRPSPDHAAQTTTPRPPGANYTVRDAQDKRRPRGTIRRPQMPKRQPGPGRNPRASKPRPRAKPNRSTPPRPDRAGARHHPPYSPPPAARLHYADRPRAPAPPGFYKPHRYEMASKPSVPGHQRTAPARRHRASADHPEPRPRSATIPNVMPTLSRMVRHSARSRWKNLSRMITSSLACCLRASVVAKRGSSVRSSRPIAQERSQLPLLIEQRHNEPATIP